MPRSRLTRSLVALAATLLFAVSITSADDTQHDFDAPSGDGRTPLMLSGYGEEGAAVIDNGTLDILSGGRARNERNIAAFDCSAPGRHARIDASFQMRLRAGAEGGSFILLSTEHFGTGGEGPDSNSFEAPTFPGSFAVGFDVSNPPSSHWFDSQGNYYDRPQREVSLHWDGIEYVKRVSSVAFNDGEFHEVRIGLEFGIGVASVTVAIDGTPVYDEFEILEMTPFEARVAFGGRTARRTTEMNIDDLRVVFSDPVGDPLEPTRVVLFDDEIVHAGNRTPTAIVDLPPASLETARVVLSLMLDAPPGGCDPWDKSAAIYVWDDNNVRYEITRFITPYGRPYSWKVDVTDFQSILRGQCKVGLYVDTWMGKTDPAEQKGWKIDVELAYHAGKPAREAYRVINLWTGQPVYGDPGSPLSAWFSPYEIEIDNAATDARLRIMVTGHGMYPATNNAAEFMPADRTVRVNGTSHENRLWKDDCYLNPCRPQGGTWKFDRAGWAPGDIVSPWIIEIGHTELGEAVSDSARRTVEISYEPMPYINQKHGETSPTHWVESQLILYR